MENTHDQRQALSDWFENTGGVCKGPWVLLFPVGRTRSRINYGDGRVVAKMWESPALNRENRMVLSLSSGGGGRPAGQEKQGGPRSLTGKETPYETLTKTQSSTGCSRLG